jgi:CRP-like cAMP-binding protein
MVTLLTQGEHFGEIGLVYKCNRTASVFSRNYMTLAKLAKSSWRELVNEYPQFLKCLKRFTHLYLD